MLGWRVAVAVLRTNSRSVLPPLENYAQFALQAEGKAMSTTMAVVRLLSALLKDSTLGPRIVPIVADEASTFGMAALFREIGIYSPQGQLYEPEDAESLMLLSREARRPAAGRRDHGSRRIVVVDCGRHVVQRARPAVAAVLYLLLDVRFPARGRSDLGGGGPTVTRLPGRRDGRAARRWAGKGCSIRTARVMSSRRRFPTAAPTIRPSRASSRSSSITAPGRCWSSTRTSSTTSR